MLCRIGQGVTTGVEQHSGKFDCVKVIQLAMPPLRSIREDIASLAGHFLIGCFWLASVAGCTEVGVELSGGQQETRASRDRTQDGHDWVDADFRRMQNLYRLANFHDNSTRVGVAGIEPATSCV
jgi:hypothetical protein